MLYPDDACGFRPLSLQGTLPCPPREYGRSCLQAPLLFWPAKDSCRLLVVAGIHGEEADTTFLLSRTLRLFEQLPTHVAWVLCANPDGCLLGTRGNARGVDLNRNWPSTNWSAQTVHSRLVLEADRITELSPGSCRASEPETQALLELIKVLHPPELLSIHSPLACVDAPQRSPLVERLSTELGLPWQPDIGYATPGSLGSWCAEQEIHCVTLELPRFAQEVLALNMAAPLARILAEIDVNA